jgi:hypothetical protein
MRHVAATSAVLKQMSRRKSAALHSYHRLHCIPEKLPISIIAQRAPAAPRFCYTCPGLTRLQCSARFFAHICTAAAAGGGAMSVCHN